MAELDPGKSSGEKKPGSPDAAKDAPEINKVELSEDDLKDVSGGIVPQPLPPHRQGQ